MSYRWLECRILGIDTEVEYLIHIDVFRDSEGVKFLIPKDSGLIKIGSDGVALLRVEAGKAHTEWGVTRVTLPVPAYYAGQEKVWWVYSHQLRAEFKEVK